MLVASCNRTIGENENHRINEKSQNLTQSKAQLQTVSFPLTVVKISPIAATDSEEDSAGCFQKQTFKLLQHLKTQKPKPQIQLQCSFPMNKQRNFFKQKRFQLHNPKLSVHATGTLNGLLFEIQILHVSVFPTIFTIQNLF